MSRPGFETYGRELLGQPTVFCHSEPLQYLHIHIFYFMLWKQVLHCLIKILTLSCCPMIAVNYTVEKG
jgi:hypothetical protein